MSLPLQAIASDVCVAPQLEPSAMAEAAAAGFKSVINNRPDFEGGPDQPTSAQIEAAAQAAGLQYVYLPVSSMGQTPESTRQPLRPPEPALAGGHSPRWCAAAPEADSPVRPLLGVFPRFIANTLGVQAIFSSCSLQCAAAPSTRFV